MNTIIVKDEVHLSSLIYEYVAVHGNNCDLNHLDVSRVNNMAYLFEHSKFNGDISQWDTSKVTDMQGMFYNSSFNGDISKWNTSNVTIFSGMFFKSSFEGDISQWIIDAKCDLGYIFTQEHFSPIGIFGLLNDEYALNDEVKWAAQFHKYKPVVEGLGLEGMSAARELYLLIKNDLDKKQTIEIQHNDFLL